MSQCRDDLEFLFQTNHELETQYDELLCLRAEVAGLLFPLKSPPPRKRRIVRSHRSASRAVQRTEQLAITSAVLLVVPNN